MSDRFKKSICTGGLSAWFTGTALSLRDYGKFGFNQ
jgi:hypothetical protein